MTSLSQPVFNYWLYCIFPAIILPFLWLSFFFNIYPTKRGACILLLPLLFSCFNFLVDETSSFLYTVIICDVIVCLALVVDCFTVCCQGSHLSVTRYANHIASLGRPLNVDLRIENHSKRNLTIDVTDDSDQNAEVCFINITDDRCDENDKINSQRRSLPIFRNVNLLSRTADVLKYRIVWKRRGLFRLDFVKIRFLSFFKLWYKHRVYKQSTDIYVYPNVWQFSQLEALARAGRLNVLGARQTRQVGQNGEFERLRDYTLDDQYKYIDWKATARSNKLIVRDFQNVRDQRIVFLIDAGRMMINRSNDVNLFDSALNSSLALAYLALKQGDEVGFLIFSDDVHRYVAPKAGMDHLNRLVQCVFDFFPSFKESRYDRAFTYIKRFLPKRSLVILITNLIDEQKFEQLESDLTSSVGTYLPLFLFLREHSLFDPLDNYEHYGDETEREEKKILLKKRRQSVLGIETPQEETERGNELATLLQGRSDSSDPDVLLYRAGAAAEILNHRQETLKKMSMKGFLILDAFPEEASALLINKYLEIKARKLL